MTHLPRPSRYDVIVIGAGAAGMMCAAQAGQRGRSVLILDHADKLAEKIRISGGGRCNFTNLDVGMGNYLSRNPQFCRSALARYTPGHFLELIGRHGIAWHEREHGQLFCDDSAQDIIDMLRAECEDGRVAWAMPCALQAVTAGDDPEARFVLDTSHGRFECASLVVATGGLSIPKIGASPLGYKIAEQFGLAMVAPKPALVPLTLPPEELAIYKELAGMAFDAVAECGSGRFRENLLFTHRGLSGPVILQVSSYWQARDYGGADGGNQVTVNLFPAEDVRAWLEERARSKSLLANLLTERLPKRFAQAFCDQRGWNKPTHQFNGKELDAIAEALSGWAITPNGTLGYAKAEVTLGGVDTRELSSKTMEARKQPGLFFVGEVMDVTGHLGGFNFQWAWASGHAAGQAA
ncbi:BaiN/RdsA family NAD(P)/FAD-dependent oxidoreductase [Zoogloea dura]|uniref:NAD(P)/FAD-dependent oxidoreductase n=1 Tax=Zoogloea dura TaxID=2728840 RepID=A0A848G815_9RHOO|nr:NAD(P)/FAD-dependent oxidoreductase [Zoogloea dura]NML27559.1 NAD(P)/FAD-dependent oxidoreductase [Zoogloea dura]